MFLVFIINKQKKTVTRPISLAAVLVVNDFSLAKRRFYLLLKV